jgi:hypothetical protein
LRQTSNHFFAYLDMPARLSFFSGKCQQPCTGSSPVQGLKKHLLEGLQKNEST